MISDNLKAFYTKRIIFQNTYLNNEDSLIDSNCLNSITKTNVVYYKIILCIMYLKLLKN